MVDPFNFAVGVGAVIGYLGFAFRSQRHYFLMLMLPTMLLLAHNCYMHQDMFNSRYDFIKTEVILLGSAAAWIYVDFFLAKTISGLKAFIHNRECRFHSDSAVKYRRH